MTPVQRGKRIKEARLSKKMTQSEVVGDFITRNMLSQIESGIATPSVKTLEYLSRVLDIPIAALMPGNEDNDELAFTSPILSRLLSAKAFYIEHDYESCISSLGSINEAGLLRDEYEALLALAYYGYALQTAGNENPVKAVEYARQSVNYSECGIYSNTGLKNEAVSFINKIAKELSNYYAGMISD